MKGFKKVQVTGLALLMAASVVGMAACGGSSSGDTTEISIVSYEGGFGYKWLDEAAARFEAEYADVEFEPGKKGVTFDITHTKNTSVNTMNTSADDMYFVSEGGLPATLAQQGYLADINDVVTEAGVDGKKIEDKIDPAYRAVLKGNSAGGEKHYFALPYASYATGLSYDIDFFNTKNCYIAADDETDVDSHTKYGLTVNFAASATAKKSKGIDNEEGTSDDGLPVSMQEFLVLCDYIKNEKSGDPVYYAGGQMNYVNGFINAMETSLSGYQESMNARSFTGEIECVKMNDGQIQFAGGNLFGYTGVQVPDVETVSLSNANAHDTTRTSARYYADAVAYILKEESYFSDDSVNGTDNNLRGQEVFLQNKDKKYAMFIEGSYWFTEARENNAFTTFGVDEMTKNIGWMPIPVVLNKADYVADTHKQIVAESGSSYCFINANTEKNKPDTLNACKKFLQFLYSDNELSLYTGSTGLKKRSLNYTVQDSDKAKLSQFANDALANMERSKVVGLASENELFFTYASKLTGEASAKVMPTINNKHIASIMAAFKEGHDLKTVYEGTVLTSLNG